MKCVYSLSRFSRPVYLTSAQIVMHCTRNHVNCCTILFPCRVDFVRITYRMPDGVETRSSSRITFTCITFTNSRCEMDRWPVVRMCRSLAAASIHTRRMHCQVYHSWERGLRIQVHRPHEALSGIATRSAAQS